MSISPRPQPSRQPRPVLAPPSSLQSLKKYEEKLNELDSLYGIISTYLRNNTPLQFQLEVELLHYLLGKAREAHSSATEKLQANVKKREEEEAVKNVGKEVKLAAYLAYKLFNSIAIERLERVSNTHVGKRLLQKNLQRSSKQNLLKKRN
jgi:hypothetical protein